MSNRVSDIGTWILKTADQRLTHKIGRLPPTIQKITPQRLRNVSLTLGNLARNSATRTWPQIPDFLAGHMRFERQKPLGEKSVSLTAMTGVRETQLGLMPGHAPSPAEGSSWRRLLGIVPAMAEGEDRVAPCC
jgi:hypothetical protein